MGGKGDGSAGGAVMYGGKSALGRSGGEPVGLGGAGGSPAVGGLERSGFGTEGRGQSAHRAVVGLRALHGPSPTLPEV